jgi:predicted HTH transcriptional regulator
MKDAGLPEPIFQKEGIFSVTLYRPMAFHEPGVPYNTAQKSREKILRLIEKSPSLTMAELAASIGISVKAIEKHIASLKRAGQMERIGPDKGGYWKVSTGKSG